MSIRNEDAGDDVGDQVLDAARTCLVRSDGRKVTIAEVAREAGVSRPTVYRRWPDMAELLRALLTREVAGVVAAVTGTTPLRTRGADDLDATIDQVVRVVAALRDDELVAVLWREQRDFMTPYVFDRFGTSQLGVLEVLTQMVARGQEREQIRDGDPRKLASMVLLMAQTAIQSRALVESILGDDWRGELHHALASYLRAADDSPATA